MELTINREAIYREEDVLLRMGFTFNELARARKSGQLRYRDLGRGRRTYLGSWLLEWLGKAEAVNGAARTGES